MAVMYKL